MPIPPVLEEKKRNAKIKYKKRGTENLLNTFKSAFSIYTLVFLLRGLTSLPLCRPFNTMKSTEYNF